VSAAARAVVALLLMALPACRTASLPACDCPPATAPVCCSNGVTYANGCQASCAGVTATTPGSCPTKLNCHCSGPIAIVCGVNGLNYANRCYADCNQVAVAHDGECAYTPHAGSTDCASDGDCVWIAQTCGGACFNKSDPPSFPPPCIGCPQPGCASPLPPPCYCENQKCIDPVSHGLPAGAPCDPARDLCQSNTLKCCGGDGGASVCQKGPMFSGSVQCP
jgi:hypothetical protein